MEEFSLLSLVERVLTLSEKDRQLAQSFCTLSSVAGNDFVPPDWHSRVRRDQAERYSLLFFAKSERPENLGAVRWLVIEVLPAMQLALPDVNVALVGNAGDWLAKELASASVKFKVLEALSCGLLVVCMPIALVGIKPQFGLTCCQPEKFAQAVLEVISSPAQRN